MDPVASWLVSLQGDSRSEKSKRRKRVAAVYSWAVERLRLLAEAQFPSEVQALPTGALSTTGDHAWFEPVWALDTYVISARRFDLERTLAPEVVAAARAQVTPERLARLGVVALREACAHAVFTPKTSRSPEAKLRLIPLANALERALAVRLLEARDRDIDALLDEIEAKVPRPS